jgi:hypothetical protein
MFEATINILIEEQLEPEIEEDGIEFLSPEEEDAFQEWFDPNTYDWKYSDVLCKYYAPQFHLWWNTSKFKWENSSDYLIINCYDNFEEWWDGDKFEWSHLSLLTAYCTEHFNIWWKCKQIASTMIDSIELCQNCHMYFDIWWDPKRFMWDIASDYLAQFCFNHFEKWWDPEKFHWASSSDQLAEFCSEHFNTWWNPELFNWGHSESLKEFCSDYKSLWIHDYIIHII